MISHDARQVSRTVIHVGQRSCAVSRWPDGSQAGYLETRLTRCSEIIWLLDDVMLAVRTGCGMCSTGFSYADVHGTCLDSLTEYPRLYARSESRSPVW